MSLCLHTKIVASNIQTFSFGPCGVYRQYQRGILLDGRKEDAVIDQYGHVEPLVVIPSEHIAVVEFHHLFYPFFKRAQWDLDVIDRQNVVVVHIDAHDDLNPAAIPESPITSFKAALNFMNQKMNEANFLYPLLEDKTVDELLTIGNPGRHHINPISMETLVDILKFKFKELDAESCARRLVWSIDLDAFAEQSYVLGNPHTEPEWTRWKSSWPTMIQYRLNPLWGQFVKEVQHLQKMGIQSNCVVIATSTHTPTMAVDDHFEYLPRDLGQELLDRTINLFSGRTPAPF